MLVVTDNAALPWSPSTNGTAHAPHWLLVDDRRGDDWHVVDGFRGCCPPRAGAVRWLARHCRPTRRDDPASHPPEQDRRNALAFGFWMPPARRRAAAVVGPYGRHRKQTGVARRPAARRGAAALEFLRDHVVARPLAVGAHLDDLWAVAQHRAFRYRHLGDNEAVQAWSDLPRALRFVVESARRGRPRSALARTTFEHLRQLEHDRSTTPAPAAGRPHRQTM
ncbi:hypothetical protein [Salinispora arenicola]|uniref:hypothetical protein n=1 Tax=Salinispora arenicola TaxID=168697 RepID=UPI0027DB5E31|nr:hypothetical protein [Salinispora arenicola]